MHLLLLSLLCARGAPPPLYHESFSAARINPLGLIEQLTLGPRWRLVDAPEDDLLFGESYLWLGPTARLSPAFVGAGLLLRVMPARIAYLELSGERVLSWSEASNVLDEDTIVPYSDATVEMVRTAGNIVGDGWRTTGILRLQGAVGPLALRLTTTAYGWDLDLPEGSFVYDQTSDVIARSKGWVLNEDVDLLYVLNEMRPVLGLRYTLTQPLGEVAPWPGPAVQRLGPVFGWTFQSEAEGFQYPSLFVLSQWHLAHPWRMGQATPTALPYLGVGFSFVGWTAGDP